MSIRSRIVRPLSLLIVLALVTPPNAWGQSTPLTEPVARSVTVGYGHTCVLTTDGAVQCWGDNSYGQLGNGSSAAQMTPVDVIGLSSGVIDLAAGAFHTCAVLVNGGIVCWGQNAGGSLGDGTMVTRLQPVPVIGLAAEALEVTAGHSSTCALLITGAVQCWGSNGTGALGDGTLIDRTQPVAVIGLSSGVTAVETSGADMCAIQGAALWCWGSNSDGQLGDGTTASRAVPGLLTGLPPVTAVALSDRHTCARQVSGALWCWGYNGQGRLGDGTITTRLTPVPVTGLSGPIETVGTGTSHTCALSENGAVSCWGSNQYGYLANGTLGGSSAVPQSAVGLRSDVRQLDTAYTHACVTLVDGGLRCWGKNLYGELGHLGASHSGTPVTVDGFEGVGQPVFTIRGTVRDDSGQPIAGAIVSTGAGGQTRTGLDGTFLLLEPAGTWDIVAATSLCLGGFPTQSLTLAADVTGVDYTCVPSTQTPIPSVTAFPLASSTATSTETLTASPSPSETASPTVSPTLTDTPTATSTASMTATSTETSTASPSPSETASPTVSPTMTDTPTATPSASSTAPPTMSPAPTLTLTSTARPTFVLTTIAPSRTPTVLPYVPALDPSWSAKIAAGANHTCALALAGTVICWGDNREGQLGNPEAPGGASAVEVTGLGEPAIAVAAGDFHTCAITSRGGVKCWGDNQAGQLGDGTTQDRPIPVDVVGLTSGVKALTAGNGVTCALTTAGTAKCWGGNGRGALGLGHTIDSPYPLDVPNLGSTVTAIETNGESTCAIASGGHLYCWGANTDGQLGDGTTTARLSPVLIPGVHSVRSVALGDRFTCALTTAGQVNCWGINYQGQLGDATRRNRSTSQAIVAVVSDFAELQAGRNHACALSATRGIWCWGSNQYNLLGIGLGKDYSTTPIEPVGLLPSTRGLSVGTMHSCAVNQDDWIQCWGKDLYGELGLRQLNSGLVPVHPETPPVIVLVHGWLGVPGLEDTCASRPGQYTGSLSDPNTNFFEKIPSALLEKGYDVYFAHIASSWAHTPSLAANARCLADQLTWVRREKPGSPIIIIAHSMGGLVSRHYVEDRGLNQFNDIRALITLGTPHEGTSIHQVVPLVLGPMGFGIAGPWGGVLGVTSMASYCSYQVAVCEFDESNAALYNALYAPRTRNTAYHFIGGATPWWERSNLGIATGIALNRSFQDDGIVPLMSSLGQGLPGQIDRFSTTENHNIFGASSASPEYFNDLADPSALECILTIIDDPVTQTCGGSALGGGQGDGAWSTPLDLSLSVGEGRPLLWPLEYQALPAGETVTRTVTVDTGPAHFAVQWITGTVSLTLQDPLGHWWNPNEALAHPETITYTQDISGAAYSLGSAIPGDWTLTMTNVSQPAVETMAQSIVVATSAVDLVGAADQAWYLPGQIATVRASLSGAPASAVVTATLGTADGALQTIAMTPLGFGQYVGMVPVPDVPGYTEVKIVASGSLTQGGTFLRDAAFLVQIGTAHYALSNTYAYSLETRTPGSYFASGLIVDVGVQADRAGTVTLAGDLVNREGERVAHAVMTVDAPAGDSTIPLWFDGADILAAKLDGPYTLTHVILVEQTDASLINATENSAFVTPPLVHTRFSSGSVYLPLVRK